MHGLTLFLVLRLEKGRTRGADSDEIEPTCTKIYYASRTHSQLSQILPELEKLKYHSQKPLAVHVATTDSLSSGKKRPNGDGDTSPENDVSRPQWRTVSLASRKQLCINDDLRTKRGDLDEMCRELLGGTMFVQTTKLAVINGMLCFRKRRKEMSVFTASR